MYIDPELVINKEHFKLIEYNVICSICSGVVVSPIQCLECENCFCESCIGDWRSQKGPNSCPFRCKNPSFRNSRLIKNLLSNLKFKCKNGCNEEIPYLDLEVHYKEKCPKLEEDKSKNEIDYKLKYLEYKNKYYDLLKINLELEKKLDEYKRNANKMSNSNIMNSDISNNSNEFKSVFHTHILYEKTSPDTVWLCDICRNEFKFSNKKKFNCEACDFDICLKCKILEQGGYKFENVYLSNQHPHMLRTPRYQRIYDDWICDICNDKFQGEKRKRFRCEKCDYDICENCALEEEDTNNLATNNI